jgi:oxygen-independent coproporphyrinogen-3 oxidase
MTLNSYATTSIGTGGTAIAVPSAQSDSAFDAALLARYDVPGPRYTSYPTAPFFRSDFGEAQLRSVATASHSSARPLSLYLHVPFCTSPCFYCGCARIITRDPGRADAYLARLQTEIRLGAGLFDRSRVVEQLHLGGGTPNFLSAEQMTRLIATLAEHFTLSQARDREFGIEIDARYADAGYVQMLARLGFNRLSLGIQDFDADVQAAVNRVQTFEQTQATIEAARAHGFRSVSVDLIYGLPKQTLPHFAETLDKVIELAPDRVAAYGYAHLPERFRAQRQIRAADMPDAATRLALLALTIERLTQAGFVYIGLDHFARPDDELAIAQRQGSLQRNFQGYSTHAACDLLGLGLTAISHIGDTFSQNAKDMKDYCAALDAGRLPTERGLALRTDDIIRADAIQRLMCHGRLDIKPFDLRHGIDFATYFPAELQRLQQLQRDGLVACTDACIRVLPKGRFLLRNIAMCFDAYLTSNPLGQIRYSQAL